MSVVVTNPSNSNANTITPTTADIVPLTIKGVAGQTADLFDVLDANGRLLFQINATGGFGMGAQAGDPAPASQIGNVPNGGHLVLQGQTGKIIINSADVGPSIHFTNQGEDATLVAETGCNIHIIGQGTVTDAVLISGSAGQPTVGFLGAAAVARQTGASAAGIAAVTDANAKAALQALQTALANLGLVTSPA